MNPLRLPLLLALAGAALLQAAVDPTAWEFRQSFELNAAGPVRVPLPPAIREKAALDAADLRLLGPDGNEVAFALLQPEDAPPRPPLQVALHPRISGRTTVIEFSLPAMTEVEMLTLDTPAADFLKPVTVETATPDGAWRVVARDLVLFRLSGAASNLTVELDGASVSRFRLTVDDSRDAPVPFTRVFVHTRALPGWTPDKLEAPVRRVESAAGITRVVVDLGTAHRKIVGVQLDAREPVFQRGVKVIAQKFSDDQVVEETLAAGVIRRLALPEGRSFSATNFPTRFTAPSARLELQVEDADNPPLTIERVLVRYAPETVAFAATRAGRYAFLAGNAAAREPNYDVAAFRRDWLHLSLTPALADEIERTAAFRAPSVSAEIPELAGVFEGKNWKWRRPITLTAPGAQSLELDLPVLAAARRDLGDLRLVRDGRQVPFLLEQSSRSRTTPLQLVNAPDPKRKPVGRWKITLPISGAPITNVDFVIEEPLFERRATLLELTKDDRGETYPVIVGAALWTRRGADTPSRFRIPVASIPSGRELILEIDHGDNAPFTPVKVEATYPLRRLRFRASAVVPLELNYGNAAISAPRYDLQLAAPRLLAAPEVPAQLAAQLEPESAASSAFNFSSQTTKAVFWASLALVVVVLLWFVAKLLPKPPAK